MWRCALLPCLLTVAFAQTQSGVRREGHYWVQSNSGSFAASSSESLKIVGDGPLRVEGNDSPHVRYSFEPRVRAADLAEARRMLSRFSLRVNTGGGWAVVTARFPMVDAPAPELVLKVPARLARLLLGTPTGNISVRGISSNITARTGGGIISADRLFGSFDAATSGGRIEIGYIVGPLECYSGAGSIQVDRVTGEAVLETAGGEIHVRDAGSTVYASTAGNILIERAAKAVTAVANGGLITVQQAGGMVTAETSGGSIQIDSAKGARCNSGAGTIRLGKVSGSVVAATQNGSIFADIGPDMRLDGSFLNTQDGDITVFLPSKLAVTVVARIESGPGGGGIVSEFPEVAALPIPQGFHPLTARGSLNGGGPVLKVQAGRGSIYLRHQK